MILTSDLEKISQKKETTLLNISRDYLQTLFLTAFYQQKEAAAFFFKGGTALHLVFNSPRYSEDLDFSAKTFNCYVFENLLTNTLSSFEQSGYQPEIIDSKPTTGGCLAIFETKIGGITIPLKIEVSLRKPKESKGEINILQSDFLPPFNILTYSVQELVKEKIEALLTRKKSRDVFDAYFILRKGWKIDLSKNNRQALIKLLDSLKPKDLSKELRLFLPKTFWPIIADLPTVLKNELGEK